MTQNNAVQPVLTADELKASSPFQWLARRYTPEVAERMLRDFEGIVLPKLRAPVANDLIHRLRCKYAMGPMIDGEPEFGWRDCSGPAPIGMRLPSPIMLEAAAAIERLYAQLRECAETLGADQIDEQRAMRAYADSVALLEEVPHL